MICSNCRSADIDVISKDYDEHGFIGFLYYCPDCDNFYTDMGAEE